MGVYYNLHVKKKDISIRDVEEIAKIINCEYRINKFNDGVIVTMEYIVSKRFTELSQLFPFKKAKETLYTLNEEYAFSAQEKENIIAFFKDVQFLLFRNDCLDNVEFYSYDAEDGIFFHKFNMYDGLHLMSESEKEDLLQKMKDVNVNAIELIGIL